VGEGGQVLLGLLFGAYLLALGYLVNSPLAGMWR
jgi:hypothetical protein